MLGKKAFPLYNPPPVYTGEVLGVAYLYSQSGLSFSPKDDDLDKEIDEGFNDSDEELTDGSVPSLPVDSA